MLDLHYLSWFSSAVHLESVNWAEWHSQDKQASSQLYHFACRYLVASSPDTIYVSFIGTKLAKDVLVDANFFHAPLWRTEKPETVDLLPTIDSALHAPEHSGMLTITLRNIQYHAQISQNLDIMCKYTFGTHWLDNVSHKEHDSHTAKQLGMQAHNLFSKTF